MVKVDLALVHLVMDSTKRIIQFQNNVVVVLKATTPDLTSYM